MNKAKELIIKAVSDLRKKSVNVRIIKNNTQMKIDSKRNA